MMNNPLDRLIGWFSPSRGLRRHMSRQLLARAYEGASKRDGWRPKRAGASANADHQADATTLRVRSRSLVQNVPYIANGFENKVAQVIGTGIRPRSMAKDAKDRETINRAWTEHEATFDADGRLSAYAFQGVAFRSSEIDGEVLVRIRPRRKEDALPAPVQFQLLEIDWLDSARMQASSSANYVVNGIEYDFLGRVYGYWLFDEHPGEPMTPRPARRSTTSRLVPASSIIHLYNAQRPGQGRGFPTLAPVIARVRDMQLYEDAELARKNLESRLGALASGDMSQLAGAPLDLSGSDPATAQRTGELGPLPSGGILQLPEGMNIEMVEPKPVGGFVEYMKLNLHMVAGVMGVTYEMLLGDLTDVNFTSGRMGAMTVRRRYEMIQWLNLIPNLLDRMWRAFIDALELDGKISSADYAVEWATPRWESVNPLEDAKTDQAELAAGLTSLSEKIRRRGDKPEMVMAEIAKDFEKLKSLGVLDILLFLMRGNLPTQPANDEGDKNKPEAA